MKNKIKTYITELEKKENFFLEDLQIEFVISKALKECNNKTNISDNTIYDITQYWFTFLINNLDIINL